MIIRPAASGCVLITQPDHAHLAGRIMEHCVSLVENPRRDVILLAIGEHDAGWADTDSQPQIDPATGGVVDFIRAPLAVRQGVWPRTIAPTSRFLSASQPSTSSTLAPTPAGLIE